MTHSDMLLWIDRFLICFYRIPDTPIFGYLLGTAVLGLICVVLGQLTLYIALKCNREHLAGRNREMIRMHNLSVHALLAKDKNAYKACNRQANDAFGKYFFAQLATGITSLWPVPFALAWMQTRFSHVDFALPFHVPLIGDSVGYTFTFIPIYILTHIIFGKATHHLPGCKNMEKMLSFHDEGSEKMLSLADLDLRD